MTAYNADCHYGDHDYSGATCKWCGYVNTGILLWAQYEKAQREGRAHDDHFHRTLAAAERCHRPSGIESGLAS